MTHGEPSGRVNECNGDIMSTTPLVAV
jgi:hypothetical protein